MEQKKEIKKNGRSSGSKWFKANPKRTRLAWGEERKDSRGLKSGKKKTT